MWLRNWVLLQDNSYHKVGGETDGTVDTHSASASLRELAADKLRELSANTVRQRSPQLTHNVPHVSPRRLHRQVRQPVERFAGRQDLT